MILKLYSVKKTLLTVFLMPLMFTSLLVSAQESVIDDINYTQLEQFIEMAKTNYPKAKILDLMEKKAKDLAPIEAIGYLDMFNASYYYRPGEKKTINPENPYSINGFQFGIYMSLGTLIERPYRIKHAKIDYEIAKLENHDYERLLITEVKNRYYQYVFQLKELKLKTQNAQDAKGISDNVALRFERGEIELDLYNTSKSVFNEANSSKMQAEVAYLVAKDQLEEMIGKKLTELDN